MRFCLLELVVVMAACVAGQFCSDCSCATAADLPVCSQCNEHNVDQCTFVSGNVAGSLSIDVDAPTSRCLFIEASASIAGNIDGSVHADCIVVYGEINGTVSAHQGDDCLFFADGAVVHNLDDSAIDAGQGKDYLVVMDGASIEGDIVLGQDADIVTIRSSDVGGTLDGHGGADRIDLCRSAVGGVGLQGGTSDDCLAVSKFRARPAPATRHIKGNSGSDKCFFDDDVTTVETCETATRCESVVGPGQGNNAGGGNGNGGARRKRSAATNCSDALDVAIIVDHSWSIRNSYDAERDAVDSLARLLGVDATTVAVGVVAFASEAQVAIERTTNESALLAAIALLTRTSPDVGLYSNTEAALVEAHTMLVVTSPRAADPSVRRAIVLLTDGNPTTCASNIECNATCESETYCAAADAAAAAAAAAARNDGIEVHAIGLMSAEASNMTFLSASIVSSPDYLTTIANDSATLSAAIESTHASLCLATPAPTAMPTAEPTSMPTAEPTMVPTAEPTAMPTSMPTLEPTLEPTAEPTMMPTAKPTSMPTLEPTMMPTRGPTPLPTSEPTATPTLEPTSMPTSEPTAVPTREPTMGPTAMPTAELTVVPTREPTREPTAMPTLEPTWEPTTMPTREPTEVPTIEPTAGPTTATPTMEPTAMPSVESTAMPISEPTTAMPTLAPTTAVPTSEPTLAPTALPTTTTTPTAVITTTAPTATPTIAMIASEPTLMPTTATPTLEPTAEMSTTTSTTAVPTSEPTTMPTSEPTAMPTISEPTTMTTASTSIVGVERTLRRRYFRCADDLE